MALRGTPRTGITILLLVLTLGTCAFAAEASGGAGERPIPAQTRGLEADHFIDPVTRRRSTIWAVGDGADGSARARELAAMLAAEPFDRLLYLGDVYETGTELEFARNYDSVYGRFASRTAPTIGNHEYANRASGYEPYWRKVHGRRPPPWYATSASGWQILILNSEALAERAGSQLAWLRSKIRSTPQFGDCRIAVWHRPTLNAGLDHGDQPDTLPLLDALAGHARMVLWGHEHSMQRLAPHGRIVPFIAGAGGHIPHPVDPADPRLRFAEASRPGALRLRLRAGFAAHAFLDLGGGVLDRGSVRCRSG